MTRKQFEAILRGWQKRLGLERWDLRIDWDKPTSEDADASTWRSNDYDSAILYLDPDWASWEKSRGRDFVNRIIVHELLHLAIRDVDSVVDSLESHLHRDVFAVTEHRYKHEYEGFVDRMSYRIVELGGVL